MIRLKTTAMKNKILQNERKTMTMATGLLYMRLTEKNYQNQIWWIEQMYVFYSQPLVVKLVFNTAYIGPMLFDSF